MNILPIDPQKESRQIINFLKVTFKKQKINHAVIGLSGGIDSAASLCLLRQTVPLINIHVVHLPYYSTTIPLAKVQVKKLRIPSENFHIIPIKKTVDSFSQLLKPENQLRLGNIMTRTRMIILFDLAKKYNALVCGTENKSEHLLGYFTRFGDAASDIEPIQHLYKTQVYELAEYLKIPEEIIRQAPSAGLWSGQTDEGELGFSYEEADQVLYLYFDKKIPLEQIKKLNYPNADKIIKQCRRNEFKHQTPFSIAK